MHLLSRRLSDSFINQASDILSHLSMASLGFITPIKPSYPRGVKRSLRSKFSIKADALTCNVICNFYILEITDAYCETNGFGHWLNSSF